MSQDNGSLHLVYRVRFPELKLQHITCMFYYVVHICVPILMLFLCRHHHHHHHHHHFPNQNMNSRCLFLFVLKSSNIPQFFPNRKHRNSRILVVKWLKGAAPTSRRAVRCGNKNRWRASLLDPFLWGDCNPAWETCDDPSSKYKDWITCLFIAQLNAWSIHQTSSAKPGRSTTRTSRLWPSDCESWAPTIERLWMVGELGKSMGDLGKSAA